jgi:hypothetical protein
VPFAGRAGGITSITGDPPRYEVWLDDCCHPTLPAREVEVRRRGWLGWIAAADATRGHSPAGAIRAILASRSTSRSRTCSMRRTGAIGRRPSSATSRSGIAPTTSRWPAAARPTTTRVDRLAGRTRAPSQGLRSVDVHSAALSTEDAIVHGLHTLGGGPPRSIRALRGADGRRRGSAAQPPVRRAV